ncbi:hypothetical protein MTR_5g054930 [Medicago truncatula]|uniref:Transmembrane protein n=1 Tax=Medicago truncatula TaxID=3880 RepID=G7JZC7_MEDTR|nr:hypothetical protein MTR_5g054930 [Medicago truncatula]
MSVPLLVLGVAFHCSLGIRSTDEGFNKSVYVLLFCWSWFYAEEDLDFCRNLSRVLQSCVTVVEVFNFFTLILQQLELDFDAPVVVLGVGCRL